MARIAGVDLPRSKRMEVALTYIYGIGRSASRKILEQAGIAFDLKSDDLSDEDVVKIRQILDGGHKVEGDLRRDVSMNIKRHIDMGSYRGLRHRKNLPVRGQRTHTNARTRKGPRKTVAGKKPAPSKGKSTRRTIWQKPKMPLRKNRKRKLKGRLSRNLLIVPRAKSGAERISLRVWFIFTRPSIIRLLLLRTI